MFEDKHDRISLKDSDLRELLALVDRLLDIRSVSDFLHYGIYPAEIDIDRDYIVSLKYGVDLAKMSRENAVEEARIRLGQIGNKDDVVDPNINIEDYLNSINAAFETDFGFGIRDLVNVQQVLCLWAEHNDAAAEATCYSATAEEIDNVC